MSNPINVLSNGIEIKGTIRFTQNMVIDGKVEGEIISEKGQVTIGEGATIIGDITVGDVKVFGKVTGKITSDHCELKDVAQVTGDIKSKIFAMDSGARLSGRTEIGG